MTKLLPIPPELQKYPELAALAILDVALDVTCNALYAAHPGIYDHSAFRGPDKLKLSLILARQILNLIDQLQDSIYWYKQRLEDEEKDKYKDLPF
ncbi:MAG: hypothetical protein GY854_20490 [Deltaproteobacteria bacterium]|nr:hypothetical protein [Deltaproteobacteria bacterium]